MPTGGVKCSLSDSLLGITSPTRREQARERGAGGPAIGEGRTRKIFCVPCPTRMGGPDGLLGERDKDMNEYITLARSHTASYW